MIATASPVLALPLYASRFVGRRSELDALHRHLGAGHHLVTLVGTAGVGKTRLALEFTAGGAAGRPPGGMSVCFCSLAAARSLDDLHLAVASALGIPPDAAWDAGDVDAQIGAWLSRRGPLIVVLDNFEQVEAAGAAAVGAWHARAPDVMFLVTGRAGLQLDDEEIIPVEPLDCTAREVSTHPEAVELFLQHATAVLGRTIERDDEMVLVASIVDRLEGIPLAIELAAARLEVLSLPDLHARLAARFRVLRDPSAARDERHATLWHAIDWSWNLLSPDEQQTLVQASVFTGGFTLDAAEAVIRTGAPSGGSSVLDAVHRLCRNSLLRIVRATGETGTQRLVWYESVREYAAERLDALGATNDTRARHAAYFLERGVAWARGVDATGGTVHLARLAEEYDNLASVLQRALALPDRIVGANEALQALYALSQVLMVRGSPAVQVRLIDSVLAAFEHGSLIVSPWGAQALHTRARANRVLGNLDACAWDLSRALAIADRCGETAHGGHLRAYLGSLCEMQGMIEAAREQTEMAVAIARECHDPAGEGVALVFRGVQLVNRTEHVAAREVLDRALVLLRAVGHREFEELALAHMGITHADEDHPALARPYFLAAIEISQQRGMRRREAIVGGYLAVLSHLEGKLDEARAMYAHTLAILEDHGDRRYAAAYHTFFGLLEVERGDVAGAERTLRAAVDTLSSMRDVRILGGALAALSITCARASHLDEAEALADRAERVLTSERHGDAGALHFVAIARGVVDLGRAEHAARAGDRTAGEAHAARARERIAPHAETRFSDQRIALRVAHAALRAWESVAESWAIERHGRWFAGPSGKRISLDRRPTLAAILAALVQHRLARPADALGVRELTLAAWPGTRLLPDSAKNRVRVAISSLRKLGLDALVQHSPPGYRLDPDTPVRIDDVPVD